MLRRLWGLNELLPDHNYVENPHSGAPKNRLEHRHHAIDAAVVAATDRGMLNRIANAASREEDQKLEELFVDLPKPWANFREELREATGRVVVSTKAEQGRTGSAAKQRAATEDQRQNNNEYGKQRRT